MSSAAQMHKAKSFAHFSPISTDVIFYLFIFSDFIMNFNTAMQLVLTALMLSSQ